MRHALPSTLAIVRHDTEVLQALLHSKKRVAAGWETMVMVVWCGGVVLLVLGVWSELCDMWFAVVMCLHRNQRVSGCVVYGGD